MARARKSCIATDSVELWVADSPDLPGVPDPQKGAWIGGLPNYVGKVLWPACPSCGLTMHFLFQFPLEFLPLRNQRLWSETTLYSFHCFQCSKSIAFGQSPHDFVYAPTKKAEFAALKRRDLPLLERHDICLRYESMRDTRADCYGLVGVLGVDPEWNYDNDSPFCPGCGKRTAFVLRLDSYCCEDDQWEWMVGNHGSMYIAVCEYCNGGHSALPDPRFHCIIQDAPQDEIIEQELDTTSIIKYREASEQSKKKMRVGSHRSSAIMATIKTEELDTETVVMESFESARPKSSGAQAPVERPKPKEVTLAPDQSNTVAQQKFDALGSDIQRPVDPNAPPPKTKKKKMNFKLKKDSEYLVSYNELSNRTKEQLSNFMMKKKKNKNKKDR